jgi:UDP-GlcNAc:undecaprenyl-phosphate GlcNAc-1-phosphate transferase
MLTFVLVLLIPWVFALALTPLTIRWAHAHGWLDIPTERKRHAKPVAMLGGVAVVASAGLGLLLLMLFVPELRETLASPVPIALATGLVATLVLGTIDDRVDLSASFKFWVQVGIASYTWWLGLRIGAMELPLGFMILDAAVPSYLVTVFWIVMVTNAFNFIDGIDGLTTGTGIIAMLTIYVLGTAHREALPMVVALALSGALAGFLRFNLPPARIFLGDGGALAVGYAAAVVSLATFQKSSTALVIAVPLLLLGLPILDVVLAVVRRGWAHLRSEGARGLNPLKVKRAVFSADRGHIHFLLQRLGWSDQRVLLSLYVLCAGFAGMALWVRGWSASARYGILALLLISGVVTLRLLERRVERREAAEGLADAARGDAAQHRKVAG